MKSSHWQDILHRAILLTLVLCLGQRGVAAEKPSDATFKAGIEFYVRKEYPKALEKFQLDAKKEGPSSIYMVAICLTQIHLEKYPEAIGTFKEYNDAFLKSQGGKSSRSLLTFSVLNSLFKLFDEEPGRNELIKGFADHFVQAEPDSILAYKVLGFYGFQATDKSALDRAVAGLNRLESPATAEEKLFEGFAALMANDKAKGMADLDAAIELEPSFARSHPKTSPDFVG